MHTKKNLYNVSLQTTCQSINLSNKIRIVNKPWWWILLETKLLFLLHKQLTQSSHPRILPKATRRWRCCQASRFALLIRTNRPRARASGTIDPQPAETSYASSCSRLHAYCMGLEEEGHALLFFGRLDSTNFIHMVDGFFKYLKDGYDCAQFENFLFRCLVLIQ